MLRTLIAAALVAAGLAASPCAVARPFTIDDLLHEQAFGAVALDPSGRWMVFEQRDPYDTAARYDLFGLTETGLSRLRVVDTAAPAGNRPLIADDPGPGVVMGAFSPTGDRLAVYRFQNRQWTLGIVSMASGAVRWLDLTPQDAPRGRTLEWLSDQRLLLIDRPDRQPPSTTGWILGERLPKALEAAATGAGAHTVFGSGAYLSVRQRAAPRRLLEVDAVAGVSRVLATGEFLDLEVSPDKARVALLESGPDRQPKGDAPVRGPTGTETEATRLRLLDLRSGAETTPCPGCDVFTDLLSWSPSGRALLVLTRGADSLWTHGALQRIDAATGTVSRVGADLAPTPDARTLAIWTGWMGESPLVFGHPLATPASRNDWYRLDASGSVNLTHHLAAPDRSVRVAGPRGLTVLAKGQAWRVGRSDVRLGPQAASVTPVQLGDLRYSTATRLIHAPTASTVALATEGERRTLGVLDAAGFHGRLTLPPAANIVAAAADGSTAVLHDVTAQGVESLRLLRAGQPPAQVATVNASLAATDAPRVLPIRHRGTEGQPLTSWLYLPPTVTLAAPAPLIVRPYLGDTYPTPPRDYPPPAGFYQNIRMLTAHGYAVLLPSLPNPPQGMTDPGHRLAERILGIVDTALAEPGVTGRVDPTRMALMGWSFGGYTVMETITQTNRFKAAVAMNGISDMTAYWAALPMARQINPEIGYQSNWHTGGVEATQPSLGAPPWKDPDRYRRNSPLYAADKVETPLLLIHGGIDVLPIAQSEAMYSALFRQGKDALLVTYWGAVHEPTAPGDVRDIYARTFRFLDAHFAPVTGAAAAPPPRPATGPASAEPRPRP